MPLLDAAYSNALLLLMLLLHTRQPMTNGVTLLTHWSVRQKLNRVISVQIVRRYFCCCDTNRETAST